MTRTWQYEGNDRPGRPLGITEQVTDETTCMAERFVYAGNTGAEKDLNLAGRCVSHYDTAGMVQTGSISLIGVPLSVIRRLLKDADNPDVVADWQGADASAWNDLLNGEAYTTLTTADAAGAVLSTTDAKGNLQRVTYDVAGQLSGSWLTVKGGDEKVILKSLTCQATGQKLREVHGNGVVTTYMYEAQTQRLTGIRTERPAGHSSGAKVLQHLRYQYDPVGNVLKVRNDVEETRFWRNQKVEPENTYVYDSLYQLVRATGREMADAGQESRNLPSAIIPLPTSSSVYTSYARTYTYDNAGNLMQVRHTPATGRGYTTKITVSNRSNRGVLSTLTENPAEVDALFTAGGQQRQLLPGQTLVWTPRNGLLKVTPIVRNGNADDRESYRYDGSSQRVLKVSVQKTNASTQTRRVVYLPGLELRTISTGNKETERVQVITIGEAGWAQVRMLHRESGQPDGIVNDALRYSHDDLIGSSGLEMDGDGNVISMEEYYPYGGTAVWTVRSQVEADYKTVRYSGKERDATGLYYYGYRYYQPWAGRWLSADPAGTVDGLNLFRMVRNNPIIFFDKNGPYPEIAHYIWLGKNELSADAVSNIIHFKANNSGYKVNLWSDAPDKLKNNLIERGYSNVLFNKVNIQEPSGFPAEFSAAVTRESANTPLANYAAASDILRIGVLNKYGGGIYMDVDVMVTGKVDIKPKRISSTEKSDILIHQGLYARGVGISNAVIVAGKNSHSLKKINYYMMGPYKGELYNMVYNDTSEKDNLIQLLQDVSFKGVTVNDLMWKLKRSIPEVRHEVTINATGPGMIDSWARSDDPKGRLRSYKLLANSEQFGQRSSKPLGGWIKGMNADATWSVNLLKKRRASF